MNDSDEIFNDSVTVYGFSHVSGQILVEWWQKVPSKIFTYVSPNFISSYIGRQIINMYARRGLALSSRANTLSFIGHLER
jgi:hypothetical protein